MRLCRKGILNYARLSSKTGGENKKKSCLCYFLDSFWWQRGQIIYPTKGSDFVTEKKNTGLHSSLGSVETNKNRYVSWTKGCEFYLNETNGNILPYTICARIRDCEEFVVTVIGGSRHFL